MNRHPITNSPEMRLDTGKVDEEVGQLCPHKEETKDANHDCKLPVLAEVQQEKESDSKVGDSKEAIEKVEVPLKETLAKPRSLKAEKKLSSPKRLEEQLSNMIDRNSPDNNFSANRGYKMTTYKEEDKTEKKINMQDIFDQNASKSSRKRNSSRVSCKTLKSMPRRSTLDKKEFSPSQEVNDEKQLKNIESIVRKNLLKSITEGIRCSQITQSNHNKKKDKQKRKSSVSRSNSHISGEEQKNNSLQKDSNLKRMITFSSELDQFMNKKNRSGGEYLNYSYEEFDEQSNISERLQIYECEMIGHTARDLKASKNKMNMEEFKHNMMTPQVMNQRRSNRFMAVEKSLQIFGHNSNIRKLEAKELDERESPKFSTCSDKEDSLGRKSKAKNSLKPSTFSSQRIHVLSPRKHKMCFLVDVKSESTSMFKM